MPSFTKKIRVPNGGLYNFVFTRIYTVDGTHYFVTVADGDSKVHQFHMKQVENAWMIAGTAMIPDWLIALEVELEKAILNH